MGFDAQAFATAFLEGQAADIKERFKEASGEESKRLFNCRRSGRVRDRRHYCIRSRKCQII